MVLETIQGPSDVKKLAKEQRLTLANEIRSALLKKLSKQGGHFGPNFGFVEATIALHYVFDSPKDKIVFDVSHQCYPHKMLTGRKDAFLYEAHYHDVSGYTNPLESEHDHFTVGHTSTSISLACGLAKARDVKQGEGNVIAIIGDGSLSGGEALEGLNVAAELNSNIIIVVNDNNMSIAENHGGMYRNLKRLRDTNGSASCNLFKAMGLDYVFVDDGNDVEKLITVFQQVKDTNKPIVVHIVTEKGKGYQPAIENKEPWHYCAPFDIKTGASIIKTNIESYNDLTGKFLLEKMKQDTSIVAITAGTPTVMGFVEKLRNEAGNQFVDVGIAEETAVAMASGIAKNGGKPVFGVYSTFIQRSYDQISHDVCINQSAVTIPVFAGSIYGMRDVTHLGIYDIAMLSNIPNLVYLAPVSKEEYLAMLDWSIEQTQYPVAIRVPGGKMISTGKQVTKDFSQLNTYEIVEKGSKVAILGLGSFYPLAEKVKMVLQETLKIEATLINPQYITGIDEQVLTALKDNHDLVITLEDGILDGGFGEKITRFYGTSEMKVLNYGFKKEFLDRFDLNEVLLANRLKEELIVEDVKAIL